MNDESAAPSVESEEPRTVMDGCGGLPSHFANSLKVKNAISTSVRRSTVGTPARESDASSRQRTRIAIVAPSLRYVGGQSAQADLLLNYWKEDGALDVKFIAQDPPFPKWLRSAEPIPYLRTALRQPLYWVTLWSGLRDVDVVHIFSASYWSFVLSPLPAWLIARWRGKAALINYHSGEAEDHLKRWRSAQAILRRAQCVVVPSQFLVTVFGKVGITAKIVPNVVDVSQFPFRRREPLRPVLVCTRGFHQYYSVDLVVRAFSKVCKEFPEARLVLVGSGPTETHVRELVAQLKLNGVEFMGALHRGEIGLAYDRADIFINASWLDNMPMSILEAFASGTAVVSTAPEGIRYLVEHERTGLLCEPGDWESLGGNVIRLLREPNLASRLATNAYQECAKYRWESIRQQWLNVYLSLAGREAACKGE